jgi:hypothetical protein
VNTEKNKIIDLDKARRSVALGAWVEECRARMRTRWEEVSFDSNHWPLKSRYGTTLVDVSFEPVIADFQGRDPAYLLALKCLMAEIAFGGRFKIAWAPMDAWRLLSQLDVALNELSRLDLVGLEREVVALANASPRKANRLYSNLVYLGVHLELIGAKGAVERLAWSPSPQTKGQLRTLVRRSRNEFKANKASILDRQIEALSDAQTAMFRGDARLSSYDRVTLALLGLNMCCPNRINEPLCMALDDRFTLEDYLTRETESGSGIGDPTLTPVHQMLLVKGSKGAAWGAKPILNFMIAFSDLCIDVIKKHGERSRMLVTWYEVHTETVYLPHDLEHLRGTDIDRSSLWQIINLQSRQPTHLQSTNVSPIWSELHCKNLIRLIDNPRPFSSNGRVSSRKMIQSVAWSDLEPVLLARVRQAMQDVRRVTANNHYRGSLSNMLVLHDSGKTPYLPSAIRYENLISRLRQSVGKKSRHGSPRHKSEMEPTLFEKLGLKFVVDGVIETAYIGTHDPRRWLTTQALDSGLPDVLANKWANRLNIKELEAYDLRSLDQRAQQAAMPKVKELEDMTSGLQKLGALEAEYGLTTEVLVVDDANIGITSMEEIARATEDRPVARTSNQIIILYPQKYGLCLHQHHERPCRAYRCGPCNEGLVVKGHLPTNEKIRKDAALIFRSIVNQLEALLIARQRQLADNPETLDEHILTIVREGLNPEEMAKELIARFHEIKEQIKDRSFANKLAEAFALTGYAQLLDSPNTRSGALIKIHDPSYHAAPGHERALEVRHGGRAFVRARIEAFDLRYPQFAAQALGKQDQRESLEADPDNGQEGANE